MRDIRKVISSELLTKQAKREKFIIYILKLLLNIVTHGLETLVLENKFLCACVREVCHL
jgi:hypothetical protein